MEHKIRYTGSTKAGWTWEYSCGESDRTPYAEAFDRTYWAKKHLDAAHTRVEDDEWVEVDTDTWIDLPVGTRMRQEWVKGDWPARRIFVHRDDLPTHI